MTRPTGEERKEERPLFSSGNRVSWDGPLSSFDRSFRQQAERSGILGERKQHTRSNSFFMRKKGMGVLLPRQQQSGLPRCSCYNTKKHENDDVGLKVAPS